MIAPAVCTVCPRCGVDVLHCCEQEGAGPWLGDSNDWTPPTIAPRAPHDPSRSAFAVRVGRGFCQEVGRIHALGVVGVGPVEYFDTVADAKRAAELLNGVERAGVAARDAAVNERAALREALIAALEWWRDNLHNFAWNEPRWLPSARAALALGEERRP